MPSRHARGSLSAVVSLSLPLPQQAAPYLHPHPHTPTHPFPSLLQATFFALSATYGFLTPELWRETVFTKSPMQEYSDFLAKVRWYCSVVVVLQCGGGTAIGAGDLVVEA